jgi:rhodanese-related sulfurtransferase/DNA-binding transcriptional ArsR family regulator
MEYRRSAAVDGRQAKDALYEQFARIGKAVTSPRRIELLELLAQGERSVETLAGAAGLGVTTTSAHLQVLRGARLVATRREGTRILYRLVDDSVLALIDLVRRLARARLAEVDEVVDAYFSARDTLAPVGRDELLARTERAEVVVLDVRPREEFEAGHIPGAISIPLDELRERLGELPRGLEVVAYCRGPYCVLAPQAVELLAERGIHARRLDEGLPEWRLAGLPVAAGAR